MDDSGRARAELENFLHAASHDLAEPARTIRGFLRLLAQRYEHLLDADGREFIGYATDAAERLEAMLEALLELARIGSMAHRDERVDLQAVVAEAALAANQPLEAAGGEITVGYLPDTLGSRRLWRRLFDILIENAILYRSDAPPLIRIAGDHERITIEDNGIGIEPTFHERIFEAFQRLHPRDVISGVGMGLTIARRIAEHHGGGLGLRASSGAGSVFVLSLPPRTDSS